MRHLWTTAAAVAALTAFSAPAEAARHSHHHTAGHAKLLRGAQSAGPSHRKGHGKAAKSHGRASARHERAAKAEHRRRGGRAERAEAARTVPSAIKVETAPPEKVKRGDTLNAISRKTGVPVEELAQINHLKKPYHVRLGSIVRMPTRRYYEVKEGDTLYSLGRRFGVDAGGLSAFNGIGLSKSLRTGQRLYLPDEARDTEPAAPPPEKPSPRLRRIPAPAQPAQPILPPPSPLLTTPPRGTGQPILPPTPPRGSPEGPPAASSAPATTPAPYNQPATQLPPPPRGGTLNSPPAASSQGFELRNAPPASEPRTPPPAPRTGQIIASTPPPTAAEVSAAGKGRFAWPLGGSLISGFGAKSDGQRNDGLNISGSAGEAVKAAADGEVVYAGDQVPSFGNLVLVKHPGGWVTAYAHMGHILVKNREQVTQGEQIGDVGQTGSVDRPQLHFEIRYAASPKDKASPVDPMLILPGR